MSASFLFRLRVLLLTGALTLMMVVHPLRAEDEPAPATESSAPAEPMPAEASPAPAESDNSRVKVSSSRPSQTESSSVEPKPEPPPNEMTQEDGSPSPSTPWKPEEGDSTIERPTLSSLSEGRPDASRELTLMELVDVALSRNPTTRVAWQNARTSASQMRVTHGAYYPTITLSIQGGPSHTTSPLLPGTSQNDQWSGGPQVGITYLLLDFGGRDAAAEAARQTLLSSNFQFNNKIQDVILGVMQAYYDLDSKRALLDNAATSMKLAVATLDSTLQRKKAGLVSETDVLQARQNKAQKVADFETALGNMNASQAVLAQSLGLPANIVVNVVPPESAVNLSVLDRQVNQLVDEALSQRPDIAAASATLLAKQSSVKQAGSAMWPTLTSNMNLQRTLYKANMTSSRGNYNGSGHFDAASAAVQLNVNLFDGLVNLNKRRAAQSDAEAAMASLAATELNAVADVVKSYIALQNSNKQTAATQALVESSQKALDSTQVGYKAGLKNILDLLTAQNNLSSAKSQNIQARNTLFLNSAQLARATGSLAPQAPAEPKPNPE